MNCPAVIVGEEKEKGNAKSKKAITGYVRGAAAENMVWMYIYIHIYIRMLMNICIHGHTCIVIYMYLYLSHMTETRGNPMTFDPDDSACNPLHVFMQYIHVCRVRISCVFIHYIHEYRVAKTHRMSYLYRSFSTKEPCN